MNFLVIASVKGILSSQGSFLSPLTWFLVQRIYCLSLILNLMQFLCFFFVQFLGGSEKSLYHTRDSLKMKWNIFCNCVHLGVVTK